MAQIVKFNPTKFDYLEMGRAALEKDDVEKAIFNFKKALDIDGHFTEVSIALACAYESIGEWDLANAVLFDALRQHPCQDDVDDIYFKLAENFLELRRYDVVEYYVRDIAEKFDLQLPENFGQEEPEEFGGFKIVHPRSETYYADLIQKGYGLLSERKMDEAILLMDKVDKKSKSRPAADHIVLVGLMLKHDIDSVIVNARRMLEYDKDNLSTKSTLATALLLEDRQQEAYEVLGDILQKDYTNVDEILMLLPILINLEEHALVVKYTKRVLKTLRWQDNTMLWLSAALYNIGQTQEARRVMRTVDTIYGSCSCAEYYLDLYRKNPPFVPYAMGIPFEQRARYSGCLLNFLKMTDDEIVFAIEHDLCIANAKSDKNVDDGIEIKHLLEWCMLNDDLRVQIAIVNKLSSVQTDWVEEFVRRTLVVNNLPIELMSVLIKCLVIRYERNIRFDVVAQDRFKNVMLALPRAFDIMPTILQVAVLYCINDIVFTDEDQNAYLARLTRIVNSFVSVSDDGKLIYKIAHGEKISRMRKPKVLAGVLFCKVYEDDFEDPRNSTIRRYGLNEKTFDKYYNVIFGDEDYE